MRGFTKAAALLSSTWASALVIPESGSLSTPSSDAVIQYHPYEALLEFGARTGEPIDPIVTFQVQGTEKACGESNVKLNGQELETKWEGTTAEGHDYLDIYGGSEAKWHISCLYDAVPTDGSNSVGEDVVHVLSIHFVNPARRGFTVSYKQIGHPAILRFFPRYQPANFALDPVLANQWRRPSVDFDPDIMANAVKNDSVLYDILSQGQKSLGAELTAIKSSLKKGMKKVAGIWCHKSKGKPSEVKAVSVEHSKISTDRLLEPPPVSYEESVSTTEASGSTSTTPNLSAAETRSLISTEALQTSTSPITTTLPSQPNINTHLLKSFGLGLIVLSCLAWLLLRCRDPRRRVDCAARREERRTKRMYRRAAQKQAFENWLRSIHLKFKALRFRYGFAPQAAISWDEKRTRVIAQEAVLEDAMADDIRALRNAHRVVSSITAAEEGRHDFVYEAEGSERRRSVSTLPGYESEGSLPPSYDDAGDSFERSAVVNGFQSIPVDTEFTSNSSVISTSPRISRDGTNSEFDEKFEQITLEASGPAGSGF
ncbi:hypothetical protein HO173_002677 [Letharia columbiana]|uniref:Uncharacterized protein n=1 Tax=Letharia columbiana TaxID=112416 RepID=A0A8H6G2M4_9LECA|nr:uncharacterized protein HO173_002677 [Letharia columbiana]KAF6239415.1 hypothetical protein HO173_002677 [Letharia columbiana]